MKNTIRCCISCILPCGALDVIRIVHANGHVEEISGGTVKAEQIMKLHPKHVLKKPSTTSSDEGACPKIVVVPPDAELQRGKIYFLMPLQPAPVKAKPRSSIGKRKKKELSENNNSTTLKTGSNNISVTNLLISDHYLSDILSEQVSTQRDRRRGRVGVWRPHLESISETPLEA